MWREGGLATGARLTTKGCKCKKDWSGHETGDGTSKPGADGYCTTCTPPCVRTQPDWCVVEADQLACQGTDWKALYGRIAANGFPVTNDTFGDCGRTDVITVLSID